VGTSTQSMRMAAGQAWSRPKSVDATMTPRSTAISERFGRKYDSARRVLRFVAFGTWAPEDASIEVHAKIPAATERLIRALAVDSIPIAVQSTRDGWVETPWLNAGTLRPTDARPIGADVVRIRGWVNPAKEGFSTIIVEAAYRPYADPSLPGRELERPVPKDHPVQVRLDSMLARIPKGRSATATLVPVPDSVSQKPDSSH